VRRRPVEWSQAAYSFLKNPRRTASEIDPDFAHDGAAADSGNYFVPLPAFEFLGENII
jgi:hypothetical protein